MHAPPGGCFLLLCQLVGALSCVVWEGQYRSFHVFSRRCLWFSKGEKAVEAPDLLQEHELLHHDALWIMDAEGGVTKKWTRIYRR